MPLIWMNASTRETAPTLGRNAPEICDLFTVGPGLGLRLAPQESVHSLERIMKWPVGAPVHLLLTVEARSRESRSDPVSIEVNWGGAWLPDDAEMALALKVAQLAS